MDQASRDALWQFMDSNRPRFHETHFLDLLAEFAANGQQSIEIEDVAWLASRLKRPEADILVPSFVIEFICTLMDSRECQTVLDPWAGVGGLLIPVVRRLRPRIAVGLEQNPHSAYVRQIVDHTGAISWRIGDPLDLLDQDDSTYDFVTSNPALGYASERARIEAGNTSLEVRDGKQHIVLLKACTHLAPAGVAAFVVGQGFIFQDRSRGAFANLGAFGLHLTAFLSFPGSALPGPKVALALIERSPRSQGVLVGELTDDASRIQSLISCFTTGKSSGDLSSGKFVPRSELAGYETLAARERALALASRAGLQPVAMSDVACEINLVNRGLEPGFKEKPNAVYVPLIGRSDVVASVSELSLKPHNYAQLVLNPAIADSRYVATFLGTALGHAARLSLQSGVTIPKITKATLSDSVMYLPNLETQMRVVETANRVEALEAELAGLKSRLWSQPRGWKSVHDGLQEVNRVERFADWLDTLPFPMASILWAYHTKGDSPKDQYERLDHFFEALSEFTATILLSGFSSDPSVLQGEWMAVSRDLARNHQSVERSSFGTWVAIAGHFASAARRLLSGDAESRALCREYFRLSDPDALLRIFSGKIIGLMQNANARRNDWIGHTGIVGERQARERLAVLQGYLTELRTALGDAWSHLDLVVPQDMRQRNGVLVVSAQRIMGVRTPFETTELRLDHTVESEKLHLVGEEERAALQLLPFVQVMPSPSTEQNACYFFNRVEPQGSRYVSYHFERDSEVIRDSPDVAEAIDLLSHGHAGSA